MTEGELLGATRSHAYRCAHFAADVWAREGLGDIRDLLTGSPINPRAQRRSALARGGFVRVPTAQSPCLVLFRRDKVATHVGVFIRGRVAHLTKTVPVRQLLAVASLGFTSVRFYAPR